MRPKEIQEKLGIDADRLKFFKREGIFFPENPPSGNKGTDYTKTDLKKLKRIVVLTKSGLTCGDIKKIQDGKYSLKETIIFRINNIEADIAKKQNALSLLSDMLDDKVEFETFNTDYYWEAIAKRESEGEEFFDLEEMYKYQSVFLIRSICCPYCYKENKVDLEEYMYNQSTYEKENGMGQDVVYSFNSENNYQCPECDATIQIEGWIREYPIGAYDSENINVQVIVEDEEK